MPHGQDPHPGGSGCAAAAAAERAGRISKRGRSRRRRARAEKEEVWLVVHAAERARHSVGGASGRLGIAGRWTRGLCLVVCILVVIVVVVVLIVDCVQGILGRTTSAVGVCIFGRERIGWLQAFVFATFLVVLVVLVVFQSRLAPLGRRRGRR